MDPPQNQINSSLAKGIPSKKGKTENVLDILYPVQRQTQVSTLPPTNSVGNYEPGQTWL